MADSRFVVRRHGADLATYTTEADALAAIRRDLSSKEPQVIALSGFEIAKRDARGRVKRTLASRELAAHLLGEPVERLGPWVPDPVEEFEAAIAVGRDFVFEITEEGDGWVLRVHFLRLDGRGKALGRDKLFLAWDRSRAALEGRSRAFVGMADKVNAHVTFADAD